MLLAAEAEAEGGETMPPAANEGAVVEGELDDEEGEPVSEDAGSLNLGKVDASKRGGDACVVVGVVVVVSWVARRGREVKERASG